MKWRSRRKGTWKRRWKRRSPKRRRRKTGLISVMIGVKEEENEESGGVE